MLLFCLEASFGRPSWRGEEAPRRLVECIVKMVGCSSVAAWSRLHGGLALGHDLVDERVAAQCAGVLALLQPPRWRPSLEIIVSILHLLITRWVSPGGVNMVGMESRLRWT
jgi:hypothetical protein